MRCKNQKTNTLQAAPVARSALKASEGRVAACKNTKTIFILTIWLHSAV